MFRRNFQRSCAWIFDTAWGYVQEGAVGISFRGTYDMRGDTRKRVAFTMTFSYLHIQPGPFDTCDLLCPSSLDLIWLILGEKTRFTSDSR
jgi:hypothetical protein